MSVAEDVELVRTAAMILAGFRKGELAERLADLANRLEKQNQKE
jgi:hypothetical protein